MDYNNINLVAFVKLMIGCSYWMGTYGQIASESVYNSCKSRYPESYPPKKWTYESFAKDIRAKSKVMDCSGLIKAFFMTPTPLETPYAPAKYIAKYDLSANMLEQQAKEKGDIKTIPEIAGLIVWRSGHVGVYIGNGKVIEEAGHSQGCIESSLSSRNFTKWLKHPMLEYVETPAPTPKPEPDENVYIQMPILQKGDKQNEVSLLQLLLNRLGYVGADGKALAIDKSFGKNTAFAVGRFNASHGISGDICTQKTWTTLSKISYA